jgi:hypothetical protein
MAVTERFRGSVAAAKALHHSGALLLRSCYQIEPYVPKNPLFAGISKESLYLPIVRQLDIENVEDRAAAFALRSSIIAFVAGAASHITTWSSAIVPRAAAAIRTTLIRSVTSTTIASAAFHRRTFAAVTAPPIRVRATWAAVIVSGAVASVSSWTAAIAARTAGAVGSFHFHHCAIYNFLQFAAIQPNTTALGAIVDLYAFLFGLAHLGTIAGASHGLTP